MFDSKNRGAETAPHTYLVSTRPIRPALHVPSRVPPHSLPHTFRTHAPRTMDAAYYVKHNPFKPVDRTVARLKSAATLLALGGLALWMISQGTGEVALHALRMKPHTQLRPLDAAPEPLVCRGVLCNATASRRAGAAGVG